MQYTCKCHSQEALWFVTTPTDLLPRGSVRYPSHPFEELGKIEAVSLPLSPLLFLLLLGQKEDNIFKNILSLFRVHLLPSGVL